MFSCTRTETRLIINGKSCGVVRRYDGKCPHKAGSEIVFTSKFLPWLAQDDERSIPFAKGIVVSVRPGTVGGFRKDNTMAERDGFSNGAVWHGHLNQHYRGIGDDVPVHHVTFKLEEVDKNAGKEKIR